MQRLLGACIVLAALALGTMQLGSDAIFSRAGTRASLPAHLPQRLGVSIYSAAARVSGAPYLYAMLARAALERGDLARAQQEAQSMPASLRREDLLGHIAQARGDHALAQNYFLEAGDIEAISGEVRSLAASDPARAYRLERALLLRLQRSGTHPDAVAEAYWQLGVLASQLGRNRLSMRDHRRAVALSPFSEKYLLSAAYKAYDIRDDAASQAYFARVLGVDPASADAYAGKGMLAVRAGNLDQARAFAARARVLDPHSHALKTLEEQIRSGAP